LEAEPDLRKIGQMGRTPAREIAPSLYESNLEREIQKSNLKARLCAAGLFIFMPMNQA
jgi:hypothetical protein